jgi:hypothetical protein
MSRIHLLLPVHHGGKLFGESLSSVVPFAALFGEILVSVNSGPENEADLAIIKSLGSDTPNLHVIVHENEMRAPAHFWKIVQSDKFCSFLDTDSVLLFFDDDLFLGTNFEKLIENKVVDPATVIIGEWQVTRDKKTFFLGDAGIGYGMSPSKWIRSMGFRGFRFTNGSGMLVPVKVLREYSHWARYSKKGARFEYFMCTHRSIESLIPSVPAIVQIYQHSEQEGANVHPVDAAWDEVLYQLWLFRQGRRNSIGSASQGASLALIHLSLFFLRTLFHRRKQSRVKI